VPPGITGWAQIHGRNALSWPERIDLDVWYVQNRSLWLDLRILLYTPLIVLSGTGVEGEDGQNPAFSPPDDSSPSASSA
jgi:lipopolysaccharide/colanic/teichoic acid biosynthesis glycosyltransferase